MRERIHIGQRIVCDATTDTHQTSCVDTSHTILSPGRKTNSAQEATMATQSSFRFLAAIMVAISLFSVTACGSVEEDAPTPTSPSADGGYDIGPDASPDAAGGTDTTTVDTDTPPDFSYEELCSVCESRGLECPEPDQVLTYRPKAAVDSAADELCVPPPPSPCDGFEWIEEVVWQCDWLETTLTLVEVDGACHAAFEDGSNLPFREEDDALILYSYTDIGFWTCTPQ